jgi:hypothetical protein
LLQHQALPDRSRFSHLLLLHLQKSSATARTTAVGPPVVVSFSPTVAAHLEAPQSLAQIKQQCALPLTKISILIHFNYFLCKNF